MEILGNKLLKNVKTYWIFVMEPSKWVMNEYHTLMVRMVFDFVNKNSTKVNFELLL
jgi:hypothetical protein